MDSGKQFRQEYLKGKILNSNWNWREVDERDQHRIQCDRVTMCGENAKWASRSVLPCSYVCDYHRAVFDSTKTFWKDDFNSDPKHDELDGHCYEGCSCLDDGSAA